MLGLQDPCFEMTHLFFWFLFPICDWLVTCNLRKSVSTKFVASTKRPFITLCNSIDNNLIMAELVRIDPYDLFVLSNRSDSPPVACLVQPKNEVHRPEPATVETAYHFPLQDSYFNCFTPLNLS